LTLHSKSLNP